MGVVALAEGLSKATQTFPQTLSLSKTGMGDDGMADVASLISEGRMEKLKGLALSDNRCVTNEGIIALARAVDAHGLPSLTHFDGSVKAGGVTIGGISAIAIAVINSCPKLESMHVPHLFPPDYTPYRMVREMVHGMLLATGRDNVEMY